jgi:biopolymer transport protein ExbB
MTRLFSEPDRARRFLATAFLAAALLVCHASASAQVATPAPVPAEVKPATTSAAPPAKTAEKLTLMQLMMKGGVFMVPIVLCSMFAGAVIIERFVAMRYRLMIPRSFMPALRNVYRNGRDREAAIRYCVEHPSGIARIMAAGLRKLPHGDAAFEAAIEDAGAQEVAKLKRNLRILHAIPAITPMLGLIGTVWGMIEAFQTAAIVGLGRSEGLATGIYESLVCTFAGLVVAIAVLVFYYWFMARIDRIVIDINDLVTEFADQAAMPASHVAAESGNRSGESLQDFSPSPASI